VTTAEELLQSTLVKVSAGGTNTHLRGTGWDCRLGGAAGSSYRSRSKRSGWWPGTC